MTPEEAEVLLAEIDKAIDACTNFKKIPPPPGATAYDGTANGWRILVLQFPMPNRVGYGYDGTATGVPQSELALADPQVTVCRLRREMAEKAFKHAERLAHS